MKPTLTEFQKEVDDVLFDVDRNILKVIIATLVSMQLPKFPIWMMIVAGPSAGKSQIMEIFNKVKGIHPISDLTQNTFASGMERKGEQTSLLHRIQHGTMFFKDFTTILSKRYDDRQAIMAQMREIYDGQYDKETGTGKKIHWSGKINIVASATESIYQHYNEMAEMGHRFIMYSMKAPNSIEVSRYVIRNTEKIKQSIPSLQEYASRYVASLIDSIDPLNDGTIPKELEELLISTADLAVRARSAVVKDYKLGFVEFVPTIELPTRMVNQLVALAAGFKIIRKHDEGVSEITKEETKILMKIAFDSIPKTRRDALIPLATYSKGVTTAGMATHMKLHTQIARRYLLELNALQVCERVKVNGQKDNWIMPVEYRKIIQQVFNVQENSVDILDGTAEEDGEYGIGGYEEDVELDPLFVSFND